MVNLLEQAAQSGISLMISWSVNRVLRQILAIATSFYHLPCHDGWSEFHLDGVRTTLLTLVRDNTFTL